jgi:hypothetical protein
VQQTYPDEAVVEMQADERGEHGAVVRGAAADGASDDGLGAGTRPRVEVELQRCGGRGGVHREQQQKQGITPQQSHDLMAGRWPWGDRCTFSGSVLETGRVELGALKGAFVNAWPCLGPAASASKC